MDYIEFTKEHFETFAPKQINDEWRDHSSDRFEKVCQCGNCETFCYSFIYRRLKSLCSQEQIRAVMGDKCSCPHSLGKIIGHEINCPAFGHQPHPQYHCQSCGNIQDVDDECDEKCPNKETKPTKSLAKDSTASTSDTEASVPTSIACRASNPAGVTKAGDLKMEFCQFLDVSMRPNPASDFEKALTDEGYFAWNAFQAATIPRDERIRELDKLNVSLFDDFKACQSAFRDANKKIQQLEADAGAMREAHQSVTNMVSRFLVAWKGHISDSWMDGFIECGAITYDPNYPTGYIEPKKLSGTAGFDLVTRLQKYEAALKLIADKFDTHLSSEIAAAALNPSQVEKGAE